MIINLYRKYVPQTFRNKVYNLFLKYVLDFIRAPRNPIWYYKGYKTKKKLLSFISLFQRESGLEIGGGTFIFSNKGFFPIYSLANSVDGCNYSNETIWEGIIDPNFYIYRGVTLGKQFIGEGTDVCSIVDKQYDFVVSCHSLEHIANPLKAIENWLNVIKPSGHIMLILPNKKSCLDHRRQYTPFSHLIEDYKKNIGEDDMTHFNEIITFTDLKKAGCNDMEYFIERSKDNYKNRCFHHHVFSISVLDKIYTFFNIKVLYCEEDWENLYIIGQK
ncbi:MAG: class I SAM-dependent methyltransferase [Bacteroidales bacterium]|jgi:SAM-dependent methyltransferase|nr:class I SAM-dependent methyltransferase [Bacteroidales bacterium]